MHLKIKNLKFLAGRPVCMIHEKTAKKLSVHVGERVLIKNKKRKIISIVDIVSGIIRPNQIAVSKEIFKTLHLKNKKSVEVSLTEKPHSIIAIKKKLKGETLTKKEIFEIIENIANNSLTEAEIAFFISAVYDEGMNLDETKYLTQAMVKTGKQLKLKGKIVDKHGLGGVAGNRTTPIIVSICSAAGLKMPKTSSRAITSASGTADTIESIAKVDFSIREIKKIIKKTNSCIVWGGSLGLAPVDDKIIRLEKTVNLDPPAQMLASILSKKISVGSRIIVIDIPYGRSVKVSKSEAEELKIRFKKLAKEFNLKVKVILTDGSEPIGRGIGPILEIKDILRVLKRETSDENYPHDLEEKSLLFAGELLELSGKTKQGKKLAKKILDSGKAFKKFQEIIKAQKGKIKNLKTPAFSHEIKAKKSTKVKHIDNKLINKLARQAGSPNDKVAGIFLNKKKNQIVKKQETILTIYTTSKQKLAHAINFYKKNKDEIVEVY